MQPESQAPTGYVDALRALTDSLLAGLKHRLGLFGDELKEHKLRLIQAFIWISAALFAGGLAITFASLTLVYLFWESARLAVLGGLAVFYTVVTVAIAIGCRRHFARLPHPFADTLQELEDDRACILPDS